MIHREYFRVTGTLYPFVLSNSGPNTLRVSWEARPGPEFHSITAYLLSSYLPAQQNMLMKPNMTELLLVPNYLLNSLPLVSVSEARSQICHGSQTWISCTLGWFGEWKKLFPFHYRSILWPKVHKSLRRMISSSPIHNFNRQLTRPSPIVRKFYCAAFFLLFNSAVTVYNRGFLFRCRREKNYNAKKPVPVELGAISWRNVWTYWILCLLSQMRIAYLMNTCIVRHRLEHHDTIHYVASYNDSHLRLLQALFSRNSVFSLLTCCFSFCVSVLLKCSVSETELDEKLVVHSLLAYC